jgi:two-component system, NarL family, sensor histidine kinase FusK
MDGWGAFISGSGAAQMLKSISENRWLRQAAVFALYTVAYELLRPYSNGIWTITCGLRLSCLLLLPYRYWPALVCAEIAPLIYNNEPYVGKFGLAWTVLNSIPAILYVMPVVWWCREKLALYPNKRHTNVNILLLCAVLASAVWVVTTFAVMATVHGTPSLSVRGYWLEVVQIFLGRYAGILTILPLALAFKLQRPASLSARLAQWARSRLTLETVVLLLPTLAVLAWLNHRATPDAQLVIRMAMFLPVAWLTMKSGWRAAAIGIAAVMVCNFLSLESRPGALYVAGIQAFIAFSSTCLFVLGAHISAQNAAEEQERLNAQAAVKLAQQGLYLCEVRMRQTAQALELLSGTVQLTQTRLLNRFKHMLPMLEGQNYYRQAATTQSQMYRLAESMHPMAWRERGLPAALRETIGRVLDEAGLAYRFELNGRGLSQLSPGIHAAIYRLACEAVVYVSEQRHCSTILMSLRGGLTCQQRWAVLRVEGIVDAQDVDEPSHKTYESQQLASKLGVLGLDLQAMKDHVHLYGGGLHERRSPEKVQITALLHNTVQPARESRHATPVLELYLS